MADYDFDNFSSFETSPSPSSSPSALVFQRLLGPAASTSSEPSPPVVDYAIVGVIVITLGLVLVIEYLRQKLDAATSGHSFSKVVLELMYRELTTLGVVEFWIYLLHKYWQGFNYNLEAMFVDVHFMLFYTAVFNAIQSGLVRLVTAHRTNKSWMQTEDIDIDHYVAIRKEFDRVENTIRETCLFMPKEDVTPNGFISKHFRILNEATNDLAFKARYPYLHQKRRRLLTPIRFHELRAHFIDSNNLPPKFRVSLYLKRCLSSVLLDLVHISPAAWIMLMATANLLFFALGMIFNVSMDSHNVELCLVTIVLVLMVVFVVFGFLLYFRMKFILSKILHMKLTIFDANLSMDKTFRFTALASFRTQSIDQKKLFLGGNPRIIIVVIQYMQFGYALALAIIFTFHKQFNSSYTVVDPEYIILGILLSYLVFLYLVSTILPWYTLCTSLGQLVKIDRLHETLAKLKLSEEIRMKESLEEERKVEQEIERRKHEADVENAKAASLATFSEEKRGINEVSGGVFRKSKDGSNGHDSARRREKSRSENVSSMRSMIPMPSVQSPSKDSPGSPGLRRINTMADFDHNWFTDSLEKQVKDERRRRMKCQSEGVFAMRMTNANDVGSRLFFDSTLRQGPDKLVALAELTQMSAKELPEIPSFNSKKRNMSDIALPDDSKTSSENETKPGLIATLRKSIHDVVATGGIDGLLKEPRNETNDKTSAKAHVRRGVTFSEHEHNYELKGNGSINRTVSDDDDCSDIDDVPDAKNCSDGKVDKYDGLLGIAMSDLAAFFASMQYRTVSLIFGPMQCFFYISRVEIFNIRAGIFVDRTGMWHNYQGVFFWLEIATYCVMITEMMFVFVVFFSRRGRDGSFFNCAASVFGFCINVLCFFLLLFAEAKRCCEDNNPNTDLFTRLLGPGVSKESDGPVVYNISCCPRFGTRMYGGLGQIEPWTALILLAPLRFLIASFIVKLFGTSQADELLQNAEACDQDHETDPTTKVRELWMTAIASHSDVAEKYGLFSGELLQCMLGIYSEEHHTESEELETLVRDADGTDSNNIISEKEKIHQELVTNEPSSRSLTRSLKPPMISRLQSGNFEGWCDDFAYPKARLIRRMRRCERQLLPLLDEWMVVDVVLTSHELVLFDILDESEQNGLYREPSTSNIHNGGKGSYLFDVAKGRKIVSQFNLDDVTFVGIDRWVATSAEDSESNDVEGNHNYSLQEYWQRGTSTHEDYDANTMTKRWNQVNENRLKIQFKRNSLLLRFMVDLKEMEDKKDPKVDSVLMNNVGSQTNVWCRTIARLRGISEEANFSASATNPLRSVNRRMSLVNQRDLGMSVSRNNLRRSVFKRSVS